MVQHPLTEKKTPGVPHNTDVPIWSQRRAASGGASAIPWQRPPNVAQQSVDRAGNRWPRHPWRGHDQDLPHPFMMARCSSHIILQQTDGSVQAST